MRTIILILLLVLASVVEAQQRPELFREYVGSGTVLEARITAETCRAIITEAGDILADARLKTIKPKDLRIASLNLRVCATTDSLARMDRDWAVSLHAEFVSALEHESPGNFNKAGS